MRRLLLLPLCVLLMGAKKPKEPPPEPAPVPVDAPAPPASEDPKATMAEMIKTMRFDMKVEVVDPGAEPRQNVRYSLREGAVVTVENTARTTMQMSMSGPDGTMQPMPIPMTIPAIVVSARNTVGKADADGRVHVKVEQMGARIEGATAGDPMGAAMLQGYQSMKGMVMDFTVSADGRPESLSFSGSTDPLLTQMLDQMGQQMSNNLVPFPEVAIGKGAKWKVNIEMAISGMTLQAEQIYTLRSLDAQGADIDVAMTMKPGPGGLQIPGMPAEAKVDLRKLNAVGTGKLHIDLGTLVSTGSMSMDMDMEMAVEGPGMPGGKPMVMAMKMGQRSEMAVAR